MAHPGEGCSLGAFAVQPVGFVDELNPMGG